MRIVCGRFLVNLWSYVDSVIDRFDHTKPREEFLFRLAPAVTAAEALEDTTTDAPSPAPAPAAARSGASQDSFLDVDQLPSGERQSQAELSAALAEHRVRVWV